MKKYFIPVVLLTIFICSFTQDTDNRTLFTVGGDKVTVSDFEYVYNKNNVNNQADFSEKSLRDYLALYENFRLKVREAEAMKLDTIPSLKNELEGYRKQLAKSYLSDREITDKLILEAYERSKTEVNASHIAFRKSSERKLGRPFSKKQWWKHRLVLGFRNHLSLRKCRLYFKER